MSTTMICDYCGATIDPGRRWRIDVPVRTAVLDDDPDVERIHGRDFCTLAHLIDYAETRPSS